MKKLTYLIISIFLISLTSCEKKTTDKAQTSDMAVQTTTKVTSSTILGYDLMKQNCFVCHMEKPDPSKKGQMIAPPMLRVQEHYKPSFPKKEEFVNAVIAWVKNPTEDNVMMPGAVRKFNLMPKIEIKDADLKLIAETLYEIDLGNMPKMNAQKTKKLTLNNGEKWVLNEKSKETIKSIQEKLSKNYTDVKSLNQLGKDVFSEAKNILLDKSYNEKTFSQIQLFFHNIEGDMHNLIAAKTIEEGKKEQQILVDKFKKFNTYFK